MSDTFNVGDVLKDNDPRMGWRSTLRIVELLPDHVIAVDRCGKRLRYKRTRIFADSKPRKSGLTRVYAAAAPTPSGDSTPLSEAVSDDSP